MARVGTGILADAGAVLAESVRPGPVLVVTDDNVAPHWLEPLADSLASAGFAPDAEILPAGEENKTLATAAGLYDRLVAIGADRGTAVVGLGGGVVTDLAGFAAATYLRGVPWLAVPTSVLGMVDAATGGKTGVNLPAGKNLVGSFHEPVDVIADLDTLSTLADRHVTNGLAEVVKTGLALDPELFRAVAGGAPDMEVAVSRSIEAKERIVAADLREAGLRRVLNLGHTAGHGIEAATGFGPVLHGEAVAVGLVAAARLSVARGLATADLEEETRAALAANGLPVTVGELAVRPDAADVARHVAVDKKRKDGRLALVLLTRIGEARIVEDGTADEVLQAIPGLSS